MEEQMQTQSRSVTLALLVIAGSLLGSLSTFVTAQSDAVRAIYVSAATVETNIPGVHTYAEAPKDFNPLMATDEELAMVTYVVGSCKPNFPPSSTFQHINDAVNATPAPNVVEVCPGTYPEVVGIYKPMTVEGVSASNADQAIITVPSGGLFTDAGDDRGDFLAAQIVVQNVTGEVNISNLTIDATGNNVTSTDTYIVGVFYQNSSGTVKDLTVQNQNGNGGSGVAIWAEGGSHKPLVTVEHNNLQDFDYAGIYAETNSSSSQLSVTLEGNDLATNFVFSQIPSGIDLGAGQTASVTGNLISGGFKGVLINGGKGTVSENTVVSAPVGVDIENNGVSVKSNTIYNAIGCGLFCNTGVGIGIYANSAAAAVTGNTVAQSGIGIYFNCAAGKNVHGNTILDATLGLFGVPSGTVSTNTYYNVGQINPSGTC
jgi:hypothetical protein